MGPTPPINGIMPTITAIDGKIDYGNLDFIPPMVRGAYMKTINTLVRSAGIFG